MRSSRAGSPQEARLAAHWQARAAVLSWRRAAFEPNGKSPHRRPRRGAVNRSADDEKAEHREERQQMAAPLGDPKSAHISIVGPAPGRSTDLQIRNQEVALEDRAAA
jgi:hypothetical protein